MTYITYTEYKLNGLAEGETLLLSLVEYQNGNFKGLPICVTKDGIAPQEEQTT